MHNTRSELRPFDPLFAPVVASWVHTEAELFWLAPRTQPPLTPAKVVGWTRRRGEALLYFLENEATPCGYGELNPMRNEPRHLWLGHIIVDPARRGAGLGARLTEALLHCAFHRRKANKVSLVVFPENTPAVRCYRRLEFAQIADEFHRFDGRAGRYRMLRFERATPPREPDEPGTRDNCAPLG